jgi:hypothetical protein
MNHEIPFVRKLRTELVRAAEGGQVVSRTPYRRLAVAGVVGAAVVAATLSVFPSEPSPSLLARVPSVEGRCVNTFSLDKLAAREFAFDGTVMQVIPPADPLDVEAGDPYLVVIDIKRWYKGGSGPSVTLKTYGIMPDPTVPDDGPLSIESGNRILAAGEDGFLWSCGFTKPFNLANEDVFKQAFGG